MKVLQTEFMFSTSEPKIVSLKTSCTPSSPFHQLFEALQQNEGVLEELKNEILDDEIKSTLSVKVSREVHTEVAELLEDLPTIEERPLLETPIYESRQQAISMPIQTMPWLPKGLITLPKNPIPKALGAVEDDFKSIPIMLPKSRADSLVDSEGLFKIEDPGSEMQSTLERVNGQPLSGILKEVAGIPFPPKKTVAPYDFKIGVQQELVSESTGSGSERLEILEKPASMIDSISVSQLESKKDISLVLSPESTKLVERLSGKSSVQSKEFEPLRTELTRFLMSPIRDSITSVSSLRIQVFPEHLGHIDLLVSVEEGAVRVQLATSSLHAKEAIEHQLPQLRQALFDQGVLVESIDIDWRSEKEFTKQNSHQRESSTGQEQSQVHREEVDNTKTSQHEESSGIDYSV